MTDVTAPPAATAPPADESASAALLTPAPAPAAEVAPPPAAPDWLTTLDADSKTYAETKGYKAPADVFAALKGYEPPESADKYELPIPDGESPEFAKAVAPLFHKAKLSATQAKDLATGWNEMQLAQRQQAEQAAANKDREDAALVERQMGELKREWGPSYDANVELSRRAVRSGAAAAGVDQPTMEKTIDILEKQVGFAAVQKLFAHWGKPLAEATAHGLGNPPALPAKSFFDKSNMNP